MVLGSALKSHTQVVRPQFYTQSVPQLLVVLTLQRDLNILADWSTKWLMGFNIKKCAILTITRKRNPSMYQYTLLNEAIPRTECYKYLGINISKDLRWNTHCQSTLLKANKTLGLLRRTLSPCSKDVKAKCVVYMYCIVDCYDLIFSMYVMYICIVLHYVFFLISCHLYSCFQAPRGFCNMRYINIYYYYYYLFT